MANESKTYPAPWEGQLFLACRECQKKLKGDPDLRTLAKLKKTVKRHNKQHPEQAVHVINVPCMGLCPKDGVTVCDPSIPGRLKILWSEESIEGLFDAS